MPGSATLRAGIPLLSPERIGESSAELKRWAVGVSRTHRGFGARTLVAAVADEIGRAIGVGPVVGGVGPVVGPGAVAPVPRGAVASAPVLHNFDEPPGGWANPWLAGLVHEQAASADDRRTRGAWYTPRSVVEGLVRAATSGLVVQEIGLFVDPTCGGGAFLLAALDHLVASGLAPAAAIERVVGMDVDPVAVEVSRWSLQLWLCRQLGGAATAEQLERIDIRCGDALVDLPASWRRKAVVVGNPPFATPLKTAAIGPVATQLRESRPAVLGPYADLASIHLLSVVEAFGAGSTVALVQPQSVLSSRDTEGLRAWLDEVAPLQGLWASRESLFDAGVRACAPILRVGAEPDREVRLYHGPSVADRGSRPAQRWGPLAADALGAPALPPFGPGRLGALVGATAGFRDEHYALVAACREQRHDHPARNDHRSGERTQPGGASAVGVGDGERTQPGGASAVGVGDGERSGESEGRVFTVGSIDPLISAWGREPFRFGGRSWTRPVVDRADLPPRVQRWFDRLRRPKVLLATQAKVLEPYIDREGTIVPATPLIAVTAAPEDLDRVAAVLLAPPVVLWAWRLWFGTAMSVDALKLAAKQVGELPLPSDEKLWEEAAAIVSRSDGLDAVGAWDRSVEVAELMTSAYGADRDVLEWWLARRKSRPVAE